MFGTDIHSRGKHFKKRVPDVPQVSMECQGEGLFAGTRGLDVWKKGTLKMHIIILTYTIFHVRKGAAVAVVVLAVVRPPPVRVYRIFWSPAGQGC
ncbi:MAG TPA: hypothetical protein P5246_02325 [Candidatus Omnitrophota bacterium]|nr:hypothetical protein [Candidatus Omnitrophota bacterium]HSA31315.1 hypothetical protein [Candidatus Omnitrophota bacterium]